ncbi:hypothetical protein NS355_14760 [Sphingomonas yabuuchiae]|uniref:Uncharacterized protein n=1 Tax=Sphingomonas yabuuchiae TaxID=172044 RepID=A0A147IMA8_9SPHN|nr:hypothetical protein [Sphingomonas yabuuchiae]KTT96266.1 hypothetical protein NS355_14760 [Sphingomonas yabuuchiae]
MTHRPSAAIIGTGIALSLLGWGAGRVGEIALDTLRPNMQTAAVAAHKVAIPHFSVHLSIEVRP